MATDLAPRASDYCLVCGNPVHTERHGAHVSSSGGPPQQGDHVFGDVVGAIETAMQQIFPIVDTISPMKAYNSGLSDLFEDLRKENLKGSYGHGNEEKFKISPQERIKPIIEIDTHSRQFGQSADEFQVQLCRIVCTRDASLSIAAATELWKGRVCWAFSKLMNNLVDETALFRYFGTSMKRIGSKGRVAKEWEEININKKIVVLDPPNHRPISLEEAARLTKFFNSSELRTKVDDINKIFVNYTKLANQIFPSLLILFYSDSTRIYTKSTWVRLPG
jgi:hypothetical protein